MDKKVISMIVQLMEQNRFSKTFGPKRIMSELCRCNISKPSKIQIQNKLSYHCQTVFNFNYKINPHQEKARWSIFTGEEATDQPFVFLYDMDDSNRLAPIRCLHFPFLVCLCSLLSHFIFCIFHIPNHFYALLWRHWGGYSWRTIAKKNLNWSYRKNKKQWKFQVCIILMITSRIFLWLIKRILQNQKQHLPNLLQKNL
jgi:hypothetical protein